MNISINACFEISFLNPGTMKVSVGWYVFFPDENWNFNDTIFCGLQ